MKKRIVAIVPGAGAGRRFGHELNKAYQLLAGKPVIIWPLLAFEVVEEISEAVLVVKEEDLSAAAELIERYGLTKVRSIIPGGKERQDSVYNGLKTVDRGTFGVLIHDGARPLIDRDLIMRSIMALRGCDGVITGVPVRDTIKEVRSQEETMIVQKTIDRTVLWAIQTPQVFHYRKLREAYERAYAESFHGTDDAAVMERYGGRVKVIMGSYRNLKITTPEDIIIAEALQRSCASG